MSVIKMSEVELAGKRVLIREDLNVPLAGGEISSDVRIRATLPTIRAAQEANAAVMLMSHLGRPTEGEADASLSLQPIATHLTQLLGTDVQLVSDWIDGVAVEPGQVVIRISIEVGNLLDVKDVGSIEDAKTGGVVCGKNVIAAYHQIVIRRGVSV